MTHRIVFSPEAEAQLVALHGYLAHEAGLAVARSFTEAIVQHCEALDIFPNRGAPRDDLRPGLRTLSFRGRVTIAYSVYADVVTILAVFHGGQDFESALRED
jgi:toxin ParE1/3/4